VTAAEDDEEANDENEDVEDDIIDGGGAAAIDDLPLAKSANALSSVDILSNEIQNAQDDKFL
jgi:hypothetical protein